MDCYNKICRREDNKKMIIMPTLKYITEGFGDDGYAKARTQETIILNALQFDIQEEEKK